MMIKLFGEPVAFEEEQPQQTRFRDLFNRRHFMYEMIEELPDYIVECLDEFISHYGTLEEEMCIRDRIYPAL